MEISNQFIVNNICVDCMDFTNTTNTFIALKICENLTYKSYYIYQKINAHVMFEYESTYVKISLYVSRNRWSQHNVPNSIYKQQGPQI